MRIRTPLRTAVIAAVLPVALAAPSALAGGPTGDGIANPAGCAEDAAGGEWRTYSNGLDNHRNQVEEDTISTANVGELVVDWKLHGNQHGAGGQFHATPLVADGCLYLGMSDGTAFALNADSGDVVWQQRLAPESPGLLGSGFVGSPGLHDGKVIFNLSQRGEGVGTGVGPSAIAYDQSSGDVVWGPVLLDDMPGAYTDASVVVFEDLVFLGFNNDETYVESRGGFVILDAHTGEVLAKHYTVPDDAWAGGDPDRASAGGSIWATGVVDADRYLYVGTSNPTGRVEHERTNAIIKVDLDRLGRPGTFGSIVDSYKGTPDELVSGLPTCGMFPNGGALSAQAFSCTRQDLAFGASPQLFDIGGRQAVGELQKAGVYHMAWTDDMSQAWETRVGHPTFYGNISTPATDGETVYVAASPPGQIIALDVATGLPKWVTPTADLLHFQAMTLANGVLYTVDAAGYLLAFDAATGLPLDRRLLSEDNGGDTSGAFSANSASLSIARNRLYVAAGNFILVYELPST